MIEFGVAMPPKESPKTPTSNPMSEDEIAKHIKDIQDMAASTQDGAQNHSELLDKAASFLQEIKSSNSQLSRTNLGFYDEVYRSVYTRLSEHVIEHNDIVFDEKFVEMLQASTHLTKNIEDIKRYKHQSTKLLELLSAEVLCFRKKEYEPEKLENAYKHYAEANLALITAYHATQHFADVFGSYIGELRKEDLKSESIQGSLRRLMQSIDNVPLSVKPRVYDTLVRTLSVLYRGVEEKSILSELYEKYGDYLKIERTDLKDGVYHADLAYTNASIANPSNHSAHFKLGQLLDQNLKYAEALMHFEAAMKTHETYEYAYAGAMSAMNLGEHKKTIDFFSKCSKLDQIRWQKDQTTLDQIPWQKDKTTLIESLTSCTTEYKHSSDLQACKMIFKSEPNSDNIKRYFSALFRVITSISGSKDGKKHLNDGIKLWEEAQSSLKGSVKQTTSLNAFKKQINEVIAKVKDIFGTMPIYSKELEAALALEGIDDAQDLSMKPVMASNAATQGIETPQWEIPWWIAKDRDLSAAARPANKESSFNTPNSFEIIIKSGTSTQDIEQSVQPQKTEHEKDSADVQCYLENLVELLQVCAHFTNDVQDIRSYSTKSTKLLSLCKKSQITEKLENAYKHYVEAHLMLLNFYHIPDSRTTEGSSFSDLATCYINKLCKEDLAFDCVQDSMHELLKLIDSSKAIFHINHNIYKACIQKFEALYAEDEKKNMLSELYEKQGDYLIKNFDTMGAPGGILRYPELISSTYKMALEVDPSNHSAHFKFGQRLNGDKKYAEALMHFEAATKIHETSEYAYATAMAALHIRDHQKAISFLDKCLELDQTFLQKDKPTNIINALNIEINVLLRESNHVDALKLLKKICEFDLNTQNVKAYFTTLSRVVDSVGHDDGAKYLKDGTEFWKKAQLSIKKSCTKSALDNLRKQMSGIIAQAKKKLSSSSESPEAAEVVAVADASVADDDPTAEEQARMAAEKLTDKDSQGTSKLTELQGNIAACKREIDAMNEEIKHIPIDDNMRAMKYAIQNKCEHLKYLNEEYAKALIEKASQAPLVEVERIVDQAPSTELPTASDVNKQGIALYTTGKYEEAISKFAQAKEMEPGKYDGNIKIASAAHCNHLGHVAYESGDYQGAVKLFTQAIEHNPKPIYLHNLGHAYYELSDYAKAIASYKQACELDPNNPEYHANYADALLAAAEPNSINYILAYIELMRAQNLGVNNAEQIEQVRAIIGESYLRDCKLSDIDDQDLIALCDVLGQSKLTSLDLRGSNISEIGIAKFASILGGTNITKVDLDVADHAIAGICQRNHVTQMDQIHRLFAGVSLGEIDSAVFFQKLLEAPNLVDAIVDGFVKAKNVVTTVQKELSKDGAKSLQDMQSSTLKDLMIFSQLKHASEGAVSSCKYNFDVTKNLQLLKATLKFLPASDVQKYVIKRITIDDSQINLAAEVLHNILKGLSSAKVEAYTYYIELFQTLSEQISSASIKLPIAVTAFTLQHYRFAEILCNQVIKNTNATNAEKAESRHILGQAKNTQGAYTEGLDLLKESVALLGKDGEADLTPVMPTKTISPKMKTKSVSPPPKLKEVQSISPPPKQKSVRFAGEDDATTDDGAGAAPAPVSACDLQTECTYKAYKKAYDDAFAAFGSIPISLPTNSGAAPSSPKQTAKKEHHAVRDDVEEVGPTKIYNAKWTISGREYDANSPYIARVEGLTNCYAAIATKAFDDVNDANQGQFKIAVHKAAGAVGTNGIKYVEKGFCELKINDDARLVSKISLKADDGRSQLLIFTSHSDHVSIANSQIGGVGTLEDVGDLVDIGGAGSGFMEE